MRLIPLLLLPLSCFAYNQLLNKVIGNGIENDASGSDSQQGTSVSLSSDGRTLAVGGPNDNDKIGATWIFISDGSTFRQLGNKLVGNDASGPEIQQGRSVSLSTDGRILAVGGPYDNQSIGATWIFEFDGSSYQQRGNKLVGYDVSISGALQGWCVSLSSDGRILAVGGPRVGATWIFISDGSTYQQFGNKLVGNDADSDSQQGFSVALSSNGHILAVGGPYNNGWEGATWIFEFDGSTYQQRGNKIVGKEKGVNQGWSVSLSSDGRILAVGVPGKNDSRGAALIFVYDGSTYQQFGNELVGKGASGFSQQGYSVSLSSNGSVLAVGAPYAATIGDGRVGATWIFVNVSTYQQFGNKLVCSDSFSVAANEGWSVSLSGDGRLLAVGVPSDTKGSFDLGIGSTCVFRYDGSTYQQFGNKLSENKTRSEQGSSVDLSSDGHILVVGGPYDNNGVGATWVFENNGSTYQQLGRKLVGLGSRCIKSAGMLGTGFSVSSSSNGRILAVGAPTNSKSRGATLIFEYDGSIYQQIGTKLVGNDASGFESMQGFSVSLSSDGRILAVGAPGDNERRGATWIFKYDGSTYHQFGTKLVGTDKSTISDQGWSVSLSSDGRILAVGGPVSGELDATGATWIFMLRGSTYQQVGGKLIGDDASGSTVFQGFSVSLSSDGRILAIGGVGDSDFKGATWIFEYDGLNYQQVGPKLVGKEASGSSSQGSSVSLSSDGRILAVGGNQDDNGVGATWVFKYDGSVYQPVGGKLIGNNTLGSSSQGFSVSLSSDGRTLAIGGPFDNDRRGATWMFVSDGSMYQQLGNKLVGNDAFLYSEQGRSVSLSSDGRILCIGGPDDTYATGAVWVFGYNGSTYSQIGNKLSPACPSQQGWSVSLSSDARILAVGAPGDDNKIGATWIFLYDGSLYKQLGNKLVGYNSSGFSHQGWSVSLSSDGRILAVGAPYDNDWIGATWIFKYDGLTYKQWGNKLFDIVGSADFLSRPRQGFSVSLSSDGQILAVGSPFDSNEIGATWIYISNSSIGTYSQSGSKLVGSGSLFPARQGWSVSLSSNGLMLAVGGPLDGLSYAPRIGSTWLFQFNGSTYNQFGKKLVGARFVGYSSQGTSVSLSSDGSILAVGGFSDTFGFTPNFDVPEAYIVTLKGIGSAWIFTRNGTAYNEVGSKLVGTGFVGISPQQGFSVSLSDNAAIVAVGGPGDNDSTGATWIFSATAPPPLPPSPSPQCLKPCLTDYLAARLLCYFNIGPVNILPKSVCVITARLKKRQCLWEGLTPFHCFYDKSETKVKIYNEITRIYKDSNCLRNFFI